MANLLSSIKIPLCIILILSIITITNAAEASATAAPADINTICPKASNPPYCTTVLKAATATDLKGLLTYTINLAGTNAAKSQTLAKSLSEASANPQLKDQYASCATNFEEAVTDVENINKHFKLDDFKGINVITSGLMTTIGDCRDSFSQPPPTDTSSLLKDEKTLEDICSIILVMSNLLATPAA